MLLLLGTGAQASESNSVQEATQFLQVFGEKAVSVLGNRNMTEAERIEALREIISSGFEMDTIGRFVLGKHVRKATQDELAEYNRLFQNFVVLSYSRRFSDYSGETLKVGAARAQDEKGLVAVSSEIHRAVGGPIRVDWRLRKKDATWRVIDVIVEGVSLAQTQRSEFDSVVRQSGGEIEGLLQKLREASRV